MIQKISSSDNKYNLKQNIILASAGGIALGAKEAYDTRQELSNKKQFFKKFMKTVFYDNDYLEKEKNYFNYNIKWNIYILFNNEQTYSRGGYDEYPENWEIFIEPFIRVFKNNIFKKMKRV